MEYVLAGILIVAAIEIISAVGIAVYNQFFN
jgi:hypothetical protein